MIFNLGATDMTKLESMLANAGGGQKMCVPSETVRYTFDAEEIIPEDQKASMEKLSIVEAKYMLCYIPCAGDICIKLYDVDAGVGGTPTFAMQYIENYDDNGRQGDIFPTQEEYMCSGFNSSVQRSQSAGKVSGMHDVYYVIINIDKAGVYNLKFSNASFMFVSKAEICYDLVDALSIAKYK